MNVQLEVTNRDAEQAAVLGSEPSEQKLLPG